jgi:import inner membrane translocase subunit TIM44
MYRFTKIARSRLQQIKNSQNQQKSIINQTNLRTLATSQQQNNFFQKLKENIDQESAGDDKLKEAQKKARAEMSNIGKEFDPLMEKSKKIQEDTMSETAKRLREMKANYQAGKERLSEQAQKSEFLKDKIPANLKFNLKMPKGVDPRQWEQVQQASMAAELLGTGLFGVMDIDPSYKRPKEPRMRHPEWLNEVYAADDDTTGVNIHASSKWNKTVDGFKDSNLGQRMADFQAKMDESDNTFVRMGRFMMWKVKEGMSMNAETSNTIAEIQRVEKNFDPAIFCEVLNDDFLPNILEAACRGDEDIVEDWCTEKASGVLLSNKKQAAIQGLSYQRHIYSLSNIEFMDASMDEDNDSPTIMISCSTQEIVALINAEGTVVDGSLERPFSNSHIYVFARDMEELNPRAAWRLIECQSAAKEMTF